MTQPRFRDVILPGLRALQSNWPVVVFLWLAAALLVWAYFSVESVQSVALVLAKWKSAGGLPAAFMAGAIAGGILPELAKLCLGRLRRVDGDWVRLTLFTALVYACISVMVEILYVLQAWGFGEGRDFGTLFIKTAVDMLIFTPFLSIPFATAMFHWRRSNLRRGTFWEVATPAGYQRLVLPGLVPCWIFWTPVLFLTYALPTPLQFNFAVVMEAAWSLLFVFIQTEEPSPPSAQD